MCARVQGTSDIYKNILHSLIVKGQENPSPSVMSGLELVIKYCLFYTFDRTYWLEELRWRCWYSDYALAYKTQEL